MTQGAASPARIGVVKPCCIGDCVMALPTLDSLAAAFPNADLQVFVGPHSQPIFEGREPWTVRSIGDRITAKAAGRQALSIRAEDFDLVVLLERSRILTSAFVALAGCPVAAVTRVMPEVRHESVAYLDALRGLAIEPLVTQPVLRPSRQEAEIADQLCSCWPRTVLFHPGGAENPGATMPDKRWPASHYVALARLIESHGYTVIFSGGASDRELVSRIVQDAGLPSDRSLAGQVSLGGAIAVAARSSLYVGGDTGMSHIAAAAGTPVVAIFGPTNPRRYRPIGDRVTVVAPAASWTLPDVDLRRASSATVPCTSDVTVDQVSAACLAILPPGGSSE